MANIHPISRQREGIKSVVQTDEWECLLLNACGPELYPLQHLRTENIDASINLVANKTLHHIEDQITELFHKAHVGPCTMCACMEAAEV